MNERAPAESHIFHVSPTNAKRSPPIRPYGHARPGKTGEGYKAIGYFDKEYGGRLR